MKAEYIDHMGNDLAVVNAARVSFDKESDWVMQDVDGWNWNPHIIGISLLAEKDKRLIKYLADHNHWTPFAHTAIKLRMSSPVPIRTQCFKHKQGFVENEESRRYINSEPELFLPEYFRSKPEGSVKQGSGAEHYDSSYWLFEYEEHCREGISLYLSMIEDGVCPEQARFILPQGCIVNWIWTGSLYAYANFYNKRTDSHAQKEIRDLAKQVDKIIRPLFPISWAALVGEEQ